MPNKGTFYAVFLTRTHSYGIQIFILEPTQNDFRNSHFVLNEKRKQKICIENWIYESSRITFTPKPSYPIFYTTFLNCVVSPNPYSINFNNVHIKYRKKSVARRTGYNISNRMFYNSPILHLQNKSSYLVGKIYNPKTTGKIT